MPESLSEHLVSEYLATLRRELFVRGVSEERAQQVVAECEAHLCEATEATDSASAADINREIARFGSPISLANQISKQELPAASSRSHIGPLAIVPVSLLYGAYGMTMMYKILGHSANVFTPFYLAAALALFIMGFRARRPILRQFGTLAVVLIAIQTMWLGIATYPATYQETKIGPWIASVGRFQVQEQMSDWRELISKEQEVVEAIKRGKEVFSSTNTARSVPEAFMFKGKYWMPEGVRESILFKPDDPDIVPQLRVSTWDEAVTAWSTKPYGPDANAIIEYAPHTIALYENCIRNLTWIQDQSIFIRFGLSFRKVAGPDVILCGLALIFTNLGSVAWCFSRWLGRTHRRRSYKPQALN